MKISKILVANRGEIAVRVMRTCREMGIRTVAVYSDADRQALHVAMADQAYRLGGNTPSESYLRQDLIVEIARHAGVDAIHPGYGFLSENPAFSDLVSSHGIVFIGPTAESIRSLGDKTAARSVADKLGIATVAGTKAPIEDEKVALSVAQQIGFPILFKAAAGGGGKGMRIVRSEKEFSSALRTAKSEAKNAFGDDRIYIEQYIESPRHVEIQILADHHGNTVYLGERECSIQRRHQKVIEESPSPIVDEVMRAQIGEAAVRIVQCAGYTNAGTIEFLVDKKKNFYFLEVNTRLQVEHPVTESLTGLDLVREQIRIASGETLGYKQSDIQRRGHAIECRVCAEDPADNFFPSIGRLVRYNPPQGPRVRVDNGLRTSDSVTIHYDPLMSKVITWGNTRTEAIECMKRALKEFTIEGVNSTIPFCQFVLNHPEFCDGDFDTTFVERKFKPEMLRSVMAEEELAVTVASVLLNEFRSAQSKNGSKTATSEESSWKKQRINNHR